MEELSTISISVSLASIGIYLLFFYTSDDDDQDGGHLIKSSQKVIWFIVLSYLK